MTVQEAVMVRLADEKRVSLEATYLVLSESFVLVGQELQSQWWPHDDH